MPKNGSSRSKRQARRLATQQNLRYTEALRRSSTPDRERGHGENGEVPVKIGHTALELLHITVERLTATVPDDDPAVALRTIHEALALTATANNLIDEALLEFGEVYWPGENFLADARHLDRAVEWVGSTLAASTPPPRHDRVTMLTPPDTAPQEYAPMYDDGLVSEPDETEKARQLLLARTQAVTLANRSTWEQVRLLLRQVLDHVRDPHHRRACRLAALVVDEILHPDSTGTRRDINHRILAITVGRSSAAELVADRQLMQLLHESVAATARANSWSSMSDVSAALEHADSDWTPARWGYTSLIKLIAATKQFSVRSLPRKGQQVIEIRVRRRAAH